MPGRCPTRKANTIVGLDMEHLDTFLARQPPFDASRHRPGPRNRGRGGGAPLRGRRAGADRGRTAGGGSVGGPERVDGHRPRGRGDPGARAGRVLRAPIAADGHGARVHDPRAGAVGLRDAGRGGRAPSPRHRSGSRVCRTVDAQAADPRRPHRPWAARRGHDSGVGDHAAGRVLRSGCNRARGGPPAGA